jgi:predicted nucleotidyltransferase
MTEILLAKENPDATAKAIVKLLEDASLRDKMGVTVRQLVLEQYEWTENVTRMEI